MQVYAAHSLRTVNAGPPVDVRQCDLSRTCDERQLVNVEIARRIGSVHRLSTGCSLGDIALRKPRDSRNINMKKNLVVWPPLSRDEARRAARDFVLSFLVIYALWSFIFPVWWWLIR
jgi:hypothetical protein